VSAHQLGDQLRNDFADNSATAVTAVLPYADGLTRVDLERYAHLVRNQFASQQQVDKELEQMKAEVGSGSGGEKKELET